MTTLVIGDLHGCFDELQALLDAAGLADGDRIIALGDIVDRGPDSVRVLDFFSDHLNRTSLMGNHERKHIRGAQHKVRLAISQIISREEFGAGYPQALEQMSRFPLYIDLPEAVLAHGYFEPGIPVEQQRDTVLCGTMTGDKYLRDQYAQPWYALYDGEKPLIVGHHDYLHNGQPFVYQNRVFGLDTSCVHGRTLVGLLLPEFRFVTVASRQNYWHETRRKYAQFLASRPAARAKRLPPAGWQDGSDQIVEQIVAFARAESERILAELHQTSGFAELTPRQQATAYAVAAGSQRPWSVLLHHARSGTINLESARWLFYSHAEARELLNRLTGTNQEEQG